MTEKLKEHVERNVFEWVTKKGQAKKYFDEFGKSLSSPCSGQEVIDKMTKMIRRERNRKALSPEKLKRLEFLENWSNGLDWKEADKLLKKEFPGYPDDYEKTYEGWLCDDCGDFKFDLNELWKNYSWYTGQPIPDVEVVNHDPFCC